MSTNSQTKIFTKKPEEQSTFNFKIDWRWVLAFMALFFIGVIIPVILKHNSKLIEQDFPDDILNIVYFCYFLLVINYFVFTYNLTIYYARKYKKGAKGAKGKIGSKGLQGKSTGCDICTQKSGTFKREDESTPKEIVDNSLFKKLNTSDDKESKWKVTNTDSVKNINLGIKNDSLCRNKKVTMPDSELLNDNCSNDIHTSNTYLNGAIVGFNNVYGDLYSLQFMEDANLEPNKNKSNNRVFKGNNGKLGNKDVGNKPNYGETNDFKCPDGSGIYRIDTVYKNPVENKSGGIDGIKFYCRDIKTGKDIKIKNNKNEISHGIHFGIEPTKNIGGVHKYETVSCPPVVKNGKQLPSFISGYNSLSGNRINNLKINKCSYYNKDDAYSDL
jgi:hypothetical protein